MLKLFVTDFSPNGTQDLLIVDKTGIVIDSMSEACFGLRVWAKPYLSTENLVLPLQGQDYDAESECLVYPVNLESVLRHIAASPVSDGSQVIEFIKKYKKL